MNPTLILADEPTGNLDSHSTADVLRIFPGLNEAGRTVVLITHEPDVAEQRSASSASATARSSRTGEDRRARPPPMPHEMKSAHPTASAVRGAMIGTETLRIAWAGSPPTSCAPA